MIVSGIPKQTVVNQTSVHYCQTGKNKKARYKCGWQSGTDSQRLFIGLQPNLNDLQSLKAEGIQRVISFRRPEEMAKLDFSEAAELGPNSDLRIGKLTFTS